MSEIAPGWYKDPAEPTTQRYWDGEVWIGDPLPVDATPPPGPPPGAASVPERGSAGSDSDDAVSGRGSQSATGTHGSGAVVDASATGGRSSNGSTPQAPAGWPPVPGAPQGPPPSDPTGPGWQPPPQAWPPAWPPASPPESSGQGWPPADDDNARGTHAGARQPGQQPPSGWPPAGGPPPPWGPRRAQTAWPPMPPGGQGGYSYAALPEPRPHGMALASLGRRFTARIIDIVVVGVLSAVLTGYLAYQWWRETSDYWHQMWAAAQAASRGAKVPDVTPVMSSRGAWLSLVILLLVMATWFAYEVPNIASSGQTPGKRLMGIKVVGLEATKPIGVRRAMMRWSPLGLPMIVLLCGALGFLIGGILQLIDCISPTINRPLRLALHDRRAFTVVVQAGTGPESTSSSSGTMANSAAGARPGGDTRHNTPDGGAS